MLRRTIHAIAARLLMVCLLGLAGPQAIASSLAPTEPQAQAVHALFARHWDETAMRFPEWATYRGDARFNDRWRDASPAGLADTDAWVRQTLARALALPRDRLSVADALSLELFIDQLQRQVAMQAFPDYRRMGLGSQGGFQLSLAGLLRVTPMRSAAQAEDLLKRLAAYPARLEQEIIQVRGGIASGWVHPRAVLQRSLQQLDGQLQPAPREGPFFEPLRRLDPALPQAQRDALEARALALIETQVLPAQRRLRRFIAEELLPVAPADGGLGRYPGGTQVYAQLVAEHTTTRLSPQQVHALGLKELARLHGEMAQLRQRMGFSGSFAEFAEHLRQPQHFHASPEAMLEAYRAVAKRIDPEMPRLFAELPRTPYGIRPMPAFLGPGAADNYSAPPADGSGPGWYNANVLAFERRPKWAIATLVAHETVPGHHLQSARAREISGLPEFRRQGRFTAYGEGWALYAETLGREVGLYDAPEELYGHLQAQAFRAARLVVDTGLHTLGWTREQAVRTMIEATGESEVFMSAEVDRYVSNPGQALAYMVGALKFSELRQRAQQRLGPLFDLRQFHNVVLDQGPLPLTVLDTHVEGWIARQLAR